MRRPGIRRCSQDPDSCVCDPAALDSLSLCLKQDKSQRYRGIKRAPSTVKSAGWRSIYSKQLQSNVYHVNYSDKSISSSSFYKDVYVLVWSIGHYLLPFFLGIYLSKLKHNLKNTQISHPLISCSC